MCDVCSLKDGLDSLDGLYGLCGSWRKEEFALKKGEATAAVELYLKDGLDALDVLYGLCGSWM